MSKTNPPPLTKFSNFNQKMAWKTQKSMSNQEMDTINSEFYTNCNAYFEHLRKNGKNDFEFEDEYYYTMPAISSN